MFLYVIGWTPDGPVKVGFSRDADGRLIDLQSGCPRPLRIFHKWQVQSPVRRVERAAHQALADYRMTGEWFNVSAAFAREVALNAIATHANPGDDGMVCEPPAPKQRRFGPRLRRAAEMMPPDVLSSMREQRLLAGQPVPSDESLYIIYKLEGSNLRPAD